MKQALDELSKGLASGMSRRVVLKRFAVAAVGAVFGSALAGRAAAAPGNQGIGDCARFCSYLYGEDTSETSSCVQAAKNGSGACYEFGPRSHACITSDCPPNTICIAVNMNSSSNNGLCVPV